MRRGEYRMPYTHAEQLYAPLFDYQHIEAVQAFQTFFAAPVGSTTPRGTVRTTRDTNMFLAHQLPRGVRFLVHGIRVLFIPDYQAHRGRKAEDEQDAARVLLGGELRFRVGNRDYVQDGPLAKFPALMPKTWAGELAYLTPEAEEAHWRMVYDPNLERMAKLVGYSITPLFISEEQFFDVTIARDDLAPLNAPGKLGVILAGHRIRDIW